MKKTNSVDFNTGYRNSGYRNSGDCNSGDYNSGYRNSGDCNSGDYNSGYRNSGDYNSGDYNSGYKNSGNGNSGDYNSGDYNSGSWNSGNGNSGYLNTTEPTVRMFDKDTGMTYTEVEKYIPDYFHLNLNEWICEEEMTDKEKEENPDYNILGGYLKQRKYRDAWREAWNNATQEDKEKTLKLPNWNNEKFLEITGIDVEKELSKSEDMIDIDGKKYSKDTLKEALKQYVN